MYADYCLQSTREYMWSTWVPSKRRNCNFHQNFVFNYTRRAIWRRAIGHGLAVMCNRAQPAILNLSITLRWAYMLNFIGCELGQFVVNFFKSRESISQFFHFASIFLTVKRIVMQSHPSIHPSIPIIRPIRTCTRRNWKCLLGYRSNVTRPHDNNIYKHEPSRVT